MNEEPLGQPPTDLDSILAREYIRLRQFTAEDAYDLGVSIRNRLRELSGKAAVVNIALANSNQLLFHATSWPGVSPDNDVWVSRKRKTVLRWGTSTWYMHNKFEGDENAFAEKYGLGNSAGAYAIHGGGVPVIVNNVEGVVAVVVVSGLAQHEDHQICIEALGHLWQVQHNQSGK